ncbi:DUF2637 domain-containing protein, partial [Streptomyces sp. SP17BM10]|uniref:DUF2637 domain-containing protein n=1 Tax=Streptomyces sp. SP17BM10 TaxID=3002530 RepID=UPI002E798B64
MNRQITRRHVVIAGAVVVAVTAFAASADTLAALGRAVGWKGQLSWSLPVAVDVLALVALVAWFTPGVQKLGQWMTAGSVVTSVVLNAFGHLVGTGHLIVGPEMVIGVSAVPVISMALAAHLAVEVTGKGDHQEATEEPAPVTAEEPAPVTAEEPAPVTAEEPAPVMAPVTKVAAPGDSKVTAVIRRKAEKLTADQGGKVTIDQLRELGLSRRTATDLRR